MKFKLFPLLALFSLSIFLFGCSEEKELVPEISTPKAKPAKVVEPPKDEDPELQPMTSKTETAPEQAKEVKTETKPEAQTAQVQPVNQADDGEYVIQVGIQPSKKSAESLVQKLSEKGVKAYYSSVENPGELEGTYYRVRVGFFASINDAQNFGRSVLETNGLPWWVDNRSNDAVGNPTTSENLYESSNTSDNWEEQPAVEETEEVVEEVVEEPAPAQEPAPTQEVQPTEEQQTAAPVQEAAPAPQQEAPAEVEAIPAPAAPALEVEEVTE